MRSKSAANSVIERLTPATGETATYSERLRGIDTDVVNLIRANHLDETFAERLHSSVKSDYIECLEEKRREDEYEARQDQAVEEEGEMS